MNSYCLRCKSQTGTAEPNVIKRGNRTVFVGKCDRCGCGKSKFVSAQTGEGILGSLLKLPGGKIPVLGDIPLLGMLF